MSDSGEVLGIVLTHGDMAEGMVHAVGRIADSEPGAILPVTNEGRSTEELAARIGERIGSRTAVIFTDLWAGSCGLAARIACRDQERRAAVFGVNLPILLDFLFHRGEPLDELVPRLLRKGRESIRSLPGSGADPPLSN